MMVLSILPSPEILSKAVFIFESSEDLHEFVEVLLEIDHKKYVSATTNFIYVSDRFWDRDDSVVYGYFVDSGFIIHWNPDRTRLLQTFDSDWKTYENSSGQTFKYMAMEEVIGIIDDEKDKH